MDETSIEVGGRWRFSISGLIAGIVAVAVFAAMVRGTRGIWELRELNRDRVLGLATFGVVVGLGFLLALSILRLAQDRAVPMAKRGRPALVLAMGWRALALVALAVYAVAESRLLAMEGGESEWIRSATDYYLFKSHRRLFPICGLLGLAGLSLGMVPGPPRATAPAGRSRFWWVSVVWASLAAVLIFLLSEAILPYLILIAIEGFSIALHHAQTHTPGLWRRIAEAAPAAIVSLVACQVTSLYAAHDLRFPRAERAGWPTLRRLISLLATLGSAIVLVIVTLPRLHEHLAAGFWRVLGVSGMIALGLGFAVFCAGLTARAVAPEGSQPTTDAPDRSGWARIGAWSGRLLLALIFVLSAVKFLLDDFSFVANKTGIADWLTGRAREFLTWTRIQVPFADLAWPFFAPEFLIWELLMAWIAIQGTRLAIRGTAGSAAPFDRLVTRPGALRRFLWPWAELTVVCLAALPTLLVSGIVAMHYLVNAVDWFRWPG